MLAREIAEEFPVVELDSDAWQAARLLAVNRLPGLVVVRADGTPAAILPASQVVRFLVPGYVREDPSLAGVLSESMADQAAEALRGKTVRAVLPEDAPEVPVVDAGDTVVELAALMARLRCPLAGVVAEGKLVGVVTAAKLLEAALG